MDKLRIHFEKTGRAVYISHLDLMRTMQRAFLRSQLPLKYSEGFNPHAQLTFALGEINNAPTPPQFSREALAFMFEQFRREEDEVDEEYRRRILDTFVSSILLYEDRAEVKFNITDQKTGDFERVILPISANKKPPEDDDITSNSEGSTALRLVDITGD